MFAFVSAFPKALHCTDEAQQAETVLSAVLSITLLLLRAGEIPVFPRQRYRAMQRGSIEHEQIMYVSSNRCMEQLVDWLSNRH